MKTKCTGLKSRLDGYVVLTTAFLASSSIAEGAVVYTDIDPDENLVFSSVFIDFNNDGTPEFSVLHDGSSSGSSILRGGVIQGNTASGLGYGLVIENVSSFPLLAALSSGVSIDAPAVNYYGVQGTMGIFYSFPGFAASVGAWAGEQDKYIGVSFNLPDGVHYGWIRCDVSLAYASVTVKDFAYQDLPGVPILAGEGRCTPADAPENPTHVNLGSSVLLSWDPVAGSVACQVQGSRLTPPGPTPNRNLIGDEISDISVPYALLGSGTTWSWQVRCACSIVPLEATPLSLADVFSVPVARKLDEDEMPNLSLSPNPALASTRLSWEGSSGRNTEVRISGILGGTIDIIHLPDDARHLDLDTHALSPGMYFIQVNEMEPVALTVAR